MSGKINLDLWCKSGEYLPKFMRDFNNQKSLFKAMHFSFGENLSTNMYLKDINWMQGHIYIIDFFLWFMARRGYTLQKTRTNTEFLRLEDDINEMKKGQLKSFKELLESRKKVED
jgi:hypothetical protein